MTRAHRFPSVESNDARYVSTKIETIQNTVSGINMVVVHQHWSHTIVDVFSKTFSRAI